MTPKKKGYSQMTNTQLANRLFPKQARKELERVAHEKEQPKKQSKPT